jgi:hypothetical protein
MITIDVLKEYIFKYIKRYRDEYKSYISLPPKGRGYPDLMISPFLDSKEFEIFLTNDGVIINELGKEPTHDWFIAGGPAMKVDMEPTRTPEYVNGILKEHELVGKNIGIYRIVSKKDIPNNIWTGQINDLIKEEKTFLDKNIDVILRVYKIKTTLKNLVTRLTFGGYGTILDAKLPNKNTSLGEIHISKNMGFFPADLNNKRYFSYLEIFGNSDTCMWDYRNIELRVDSDLRRDFTHAFSTKGESGGSISFGNSKSNLESYTNSLNTLKMAIEEFRDILLFKSHEIEDVFHKLLEKHPILLDFYGESISKPHFNYPKGMLSPIGKSYLEPDFLIKYPDESYKLIELERASKSVVTKQGQPRAEVGQAIFQTAEWQHFISEHYNEVKDSYPGINAKCKTSVIMSRSKLESFKDINDMNRYKGLIINQYRLDEFLTYDDLFERACAAYTRLTGLNPNN